MKRAALILAAVILLSAFVCWYGLIQFPNDAPLVKDNVKTETKKEEDEPAPPEAKTLAVEIGPDPVNLDPAVCVSADSCNMLLHLYEPLAVLDENGDTVPGAAEKWETSEDGLKWSFTLRDGLKWSDGSDLTATDFEYSWKRLATAKKSTQRDTLLSGIIGYSQAKAGDFSALGVTAPDAKTLVVELSAPCPFFDKLAANVVLAPVNRQMVNASPEGWSLKADTFFSNGAFYISEWVPGERLVMAKNPLYHDSDGIKLDYIRWNFCENAEDAYSAYQNGEDLFIKDVPEEISATDRSDLYREPIIGTYYLSINEMSDPLWDTNIRRALSLAIDREYIVNSILKGGCTPAYSLVGPGWRDPAGGDFSENANGGKPYIGSDHEANIAEAKRLIELEGYSTFWPVKFSFMTSDLPQHVALAEYLQTVWKDIGVEVSIKKVDPAEFTPSRKAGDYDVSRSGWVGDYNDPYAILSIFETGNGLNDGQYYSPNYNIAVSDVRAAVGAEERSAALHRAEDVIMDEAGVIPVAWYNDVWMQSEKLTGAWHSPLGYWNFIYADISE